MNLNAVNEPATQWWGARRLRYNVALVLAGFGAFILFVALTWSFPERLNGVEITVVTIAVQAIGYVLAMVVANLCYFLGPLSECVVNPTNLNSYRTLTYNLGLWFSVALPFLIPAVLVYDIIAYGS